MNGVPPALFTGDVLAIRLRGDLIDFEREIKSRQDAGAPRNPMHIRSNIHQKLIRLVPAFAIVCFLGWCILTLRSNFASDDADPEVLNQAWRLARGESIYRGIDIPPYAFAAYPPVYFALAAIPMKLVGLSFLPAKLISFIAALFIGWAFVHLAGVWSRNPAGGLWAAFFLFLVPAFLYNSARCQVQMTAVALSAWSFVFFLRNRWWETVLISPLLAVVAFYTKQTQVALPLAMAGYLLFRNRRRLVPYLATLSIAGLIPLVLLQRFTGGLFFFDTVQLARLAYNVYFIPLIFLHHAGPILPFIGLAVVLCWRHFKEQTWDPADWYFACVLIVTIISLGRLGAHGQYVLELIVVTILFLLRNTTLPRIAGHETLVSVQVLFLLIYAPLFVSLEEGLEAISASRAAPEVYRLLQSRPGPIVSQQGSFALFGQGEIYVQLFHFAALSRAGMWDQSRLLKDFERRTIGAVVTEFPIETGIQTDSDQERFTPEMLQSLRRNYHRWRVVYPYYLYAPNP